MSCSHDIDAFAKLNFFSVVFEKVLTFVAMEML